MGRDESSHGVELVFPTAWNSHSHGVELAFPRRGTHIPTAWDLDCFGEESEKRGMSVCFSLPLKEVSSTAKRGSAWQRMGTEE